MNRTWIFAIVCSLTIFGVFSEEKFVEKTAEEFLRNFNKESRKAKSKTVELQLNLENEETDTTKDDFFQAMFEECNVIRQTFLNTKKYPWYSLKDSKVSRQMKLLSTIGLLALSPDEYHKLKQIRSNWKDVENNTTICDFFNKTNCSLHLNPDIRDKLKTSRNPKELSYIVEEWKKATGPRLEKLFVKYLKLCRRAAILNNLTNLEEHYLWNSELPNFDIANIKNEMESLWEKVKPLYMELHAYVRRRLRNIYGENLIPKYGTIPSYLLGELNTGNWLAIADNILPYPDALKPNLKLLMMSKNYNSSAMHKNADDYFQSMNFSSLPDLWLNCDTKHSYRNEEKNEFQVMDLGQGKGIRIKHCHTELPDEFFKALKLMTKAEYMSLTEKQTRPYCDHYDTGLEKSLVDTTMLSASTIKYLNKLGLYNGNETHEMRINRLFKSALEQIIPIPLTLVQEIRRIDILGGKDIESDAKHKQTLSEKYQGLNTFTKDLNFDPGGVYDTFMSSPPIYNFVNYFLRYLIYDFLCADPTGANKEDFDQCCLYGNLAAGSKMRNLMSLSCYKPLTEVLEYLTGRSKLSETSLLKYFDPLMKWLQEENIKSGETVGWVEVLHREPDRRMKKSRRKRSLDMSMEYSDVSPGTVETLLKLRGKISKRDGLYEMMEYLRERKDKNVQGALGFALKNEPNEIAYASKVKRSASQGKNSGKEGWSVNFLKQDKSLDVQNIDNEPLTDQFRVQNLENVIKTDDIRSLWNSKKENNDEAQEQYHTSKGIISGKRYKRRLMKRDNYEYMKRPSKKSYMKTPDIFDLNNQDRYNVNPYNLNVNINTDKTKARFVKSIADARRRHVNGDVQRKNDVQEKRDERVSREVQWHSNNKKDISRLLHSFGFAVENEEKDKLKEMKKKLKGGTEGNGENDESDEGKFRNGYQIDWSNADLKKKAFNQKKERMTEDEEAMANANRMNRLNSMSGVNPFNSISRMNDFNSMNGFYSGNSMNNPNSVNNMMNPNKMGHYDAAAQNSEQKSSIMSKYVNNVNTDIQSDYGHLKAADGRTYNLADKKKAWTVEKLTTDDGENNAIYGGMRDSYDASHLNTVLTPEEKMFGKKEVVSDQQRSQFKEKSIDSSSSAGARNADPSVENVNLNVPSVQILLKNPNLKVYRQDGSYGAGSENVHAKIKADSNQINGGNKGKLTADSSKECKVMNRADDTVQLKDANDYREVGRHSYKSPFVIILGQLTPQMKERLTQTEGDAQSLLKEEEKNQQLHEESERNANKMDGKRNGVSDKIYIIPIEMKDNQYVPKSVQYIEPNSVSDVNGGKDKDAQEKLIRLPGNSKLNDKSGFFKGGKENPSHFTVGCDEKAKTLLKRSKRELDQDSGSALTGLKMIQISPMMESRLENLLAKSFDRAAMGDSSPEMLIQDGSIVGDNEMSPLSSGVPSIYMAPDSSIGSPSMSLPSFASPSAESQAAMLGLSSVDGSSSVNGQGSAGSPSSSFSSQLSTVLSALAPKTAAQAKGLARPRQELEDETGESKMESGGGGNNIGLTKDQKDQDLTLMNNPNLRCSTCVGKKKTGSKSSPEEEQCKRIADCESPTKGDDSSCKKLILTSSTPKCGPSQPPCSCSLPCPCPRPPPCGSSPCPYPPLTPPSTPPPTPPPCGTCPCPCPTPYPSVSSCPPPCCEPCCDPCCRKPSECSLVNCQFKITKAKKPHERLTIMIYDRINPPADLPEPYDALAVIGEVLQRIQCSNPKPCTQLTEEDPDYPANDNTDQLKSSSQNQASEAGRIRSEEEVSGELPIFRNEIPEEEEDDDGSQANSEENKPQSREKSTPAIDQLTVFNKDRLKPVLIELRKRFLVPPIEAPANHVPGYAKSPIDDLVKKWSE